MVGQVKEGANNSTLLPAGFLAALGLDPGEVPPRQAVQLSRTKLQAYRYPNLRPHGLDQPVTLFTTPTSAGVATVACVDPGADCETIANTLKLNAGTAFPVGPSKEYAAGLGKVLGALDKKVKSGRKRAGRREDAEGAGRRGEGPLVRVQRRVGVGLEARGLARRRDRQRSSSRAALKQTGGAYGKLAAAASSGNKSRLQRRRVRPCRAPSRRSTGALGGLEAAGYKVAS